MKNRMTFIMMLLVLIGLSTNVYGESYQRWSNVPGRVLTSYDFLEDPDLVAHNDDLILVFIDANDTPEVSIPYDNPLTHTRTICWDQEDSSHTATLVDAFGDPVFTLGPGECVSPTIEEGLYTLSFTHDGTSGPATFVLEPASGETEVSANYNQKDLDRLKSTNQCPQCNLTGAILTGANLIQANLNQANLTGANLIQANLIQANLIQANLTRANLTGAILTRANLTGTILYGATWIDGSLCGRGSIGQCIPARPH